jgi:histidine triad (HIT) family protein
MCIFCKIIDRKLEAAWVYETTSIAVFADACPSAPGHVLVIPKRHVEKVTDLTELEAQELYRVVFLVQKAMVDVWQIPGQNLQINSGVIAGQEVMHAHIHVIPRKKARSGEPAIFVPLETRVLAVKGLKDYFDRLLEKND